MFVDRYYQNWRVSTFISVTPQLKSIMYLDSEGNVTKYLALLGSTGPRKSRGGGLRAPTPERIRLNLIGRDEISTYVPI